MKSRKPPVIVYPKENAPDEVIDEYSLAFNIADALSHCVKLGFCEHEDIEEVRYPSKAAGSFRVKANGVRYVVQVRVERAEGPKR